jgi:alkylation response protein AidB-like acyl-CoA dehydrogenase
MDFELSEEQASIAELAGKILGDLCTPDLLRAHEQTGEPTLEKAWSALASSDLLGIALPEAVGGGGYGIVEASLVAEQVGRHVAPVPYLSTTAAALTLAAIGGHDDVLRGVASGDVVLAPVFEDDGPAPWAAQAAHLLVARDGELRLVDAGDPAVRVTPEDAMWGLPEATVDLEGAAGTVVGGRDEIDAMRRVAIALHCAAVAGVCEGAMRITAAYVSDREQFGTKIGTFQAVAQRIADAYIDTQGCRLTAVQAAWRLSEGLPADEELHIAKFWATEAGHRVAHAAQHLHGGIGVDIDYPVHRYFRWAKVLELQLGNGTDHLRRLGALIAAEPA